MLIIYDSLTGNVAHFVKKTGFPSKPVKDGLILQEPFIMVTHTIRFGEVPSNTEAFLKRNHLFMRGVASSGNRIWGANFAIAADKISFKYGVPNLLKFELRGTKMDVSTFQEKVQALTDTLPIDKAI